MSHKRINTHQNLGLRRRLLAGSFTHNRLVSPQSRQQHITQCRLLLCACNACLWTQGTRDQELSLSAKAYLWWLLTIANKRGETFCICQEAYHYRHPHRPLAFHWASPSEMSSPLWVYPFCNVKSSDKLAEACLGRPFHTQQSSVSANLSSTMQIPSMRWNAAAGVWQAPADGASFHL